MKTGLILMTALPPTKGHQFLIDFAKTYLNDDYILDVVISGRDHEPIPTSVRVEVFKQKDVRVNIWAMDKNMPQKPDDHPQFWDLWRDEIQKITQLVGYDYVFASEIYGITLAEFWNDCTFVPCNIYRDTLNISATKIRNDPLGSFAFLHPQFQKHARKTITIFGPESVGKTTLSKALSSRINGHLVPEWAREYLECVAGSDITRDKMQQIWTGQQTLERTISNCFLDKPFVIRDTDLLSTHGYYKLWDVSQLLSIENYTFADLYILPNETIPFTPDPLRYGGDKRESDNKFWIEILKEFNLNYYEIQSYSPDAQLREAELVCRNLFYKHNNWKFDR